MDFDDQEGGLYWVAEVHKSGYLELLVQTRQEIQFRIIKVNKSWGWTY
jgi:hypothetical protein